MLHGYHVGSVGAKGQAMENPGSPMDILEHDGQNA